MIFRSFKLILIGLLFLSNTCSKEDIDYLPKCSLENAVKSVSNVSGSIWFDLQSQAYAIFRGIDGTYDTQEIGVVCNLPQDYNEEGQEVIFSGNYYENKDFPPLIPGQKYYYLELTEIAPIRKIE